jgi:hypothetical protein
MGEARSTFGREERRGAYNLGERDHLEKQAVYGRILKWIF